MKRFLFSAFLAILIGLVATQSAYAMTQVPIPTFEFPPALEIALVGFLASYITQGLKNRFPKIADGLAVFVSAVVSTLLAALTGVINTGVDPLFWPLLTQGAIALATWLTSLAVFKIHIQPKLKLERAWSEISDLRSPR